MKHADKKIMFNAQFARRRHHPLRLKSSQPSLHSFAIGAYSVRQYCSALLADVTYVVPVQNISTP